MNFCDEIIKRNLSQPFKQSLVTSKKYRFVYLVIPRLDKSNGSLKPGGLTVWSIHRFSRHMCLEIKLFESDNSAELWHRGRFLGGKSN